MQRSTFTELLVVRQQRILRDPRQCMTNCLGQTSIHRLAISNRLTASQHLRGQCIELLIDEFTFRLQGLVARYRSRARLVDSRRALSPQDWANERHPTPEGFGKIAARWESQLQADGRLVS
jgi:hypothetical protein